MRVKLLLWSDLPDDILIRDTNHVSAGFYGIGTLKTMVVGKFRTEGIELIKTTPILGSIDGVDSTLAASTFLYMRGGVLVNGLIYHSIDSIRVKEVERESYLEAIPRIFAEFYGEDRVYYDSQGIVYVWFPEITITNSHENSHKIKDLVVCVDIDPNTGFTTGRLLGKRYTLTTAEHVAGYAHSHLSSREPYNFQLFCLGDGPLAKFTQFENKSMSVPEIAMLAFAIRPYVEWESLEGSPYISFEDIASTGPTDFRAAVNIASDAAFISEHAALEYAHTFIRAASALPRNMRPFRKRGSTVEVDVSNPLFHYILKKNINTEMPKLHISKTGIYHQPVMESNHSTFLQSEPLSKGPIQLRPRIEHQEREQLTEVIDPRVVHQIICHINKILTIASFKHEQKRETVSVAGTAVSDYHSTHNV